MHDRGTSFVTATVVASSISIVGFRFFFGSDSVNATTTGHAVDSTAVTMAAGNSNKRKFF